MCRLFLSVVPKGKARIERQLSAAHSREAFGACLSCFYRTSKLNRYLIPFLGSRLVPKVSIYDCFFTALIYKVIKLDWLPENGLPKTDAFQ